MLYRYIPFVSLGEEHGMVQAVTLIPFLLRKKKEIAIQPAVFAIVEEKIFKRQYIQDNFKWAIMVKERSSRKCT